MNIDISSAALVGVIATVGGHIIIHIFRQGELNQWRKEVDDKLDDMGAAVAKMQEIHNLEQLNAQKLNQVAADLKDHKQATERQFTNLGNKIDGMVTKVVETLGELARK